MAHFLYLVIWNIQTKWGNMRQHDFAKTASQPRTIILGVLLTAALALFLSFESVSAYGLTSEFSIKLKAKDRVLGSMEGNILVYGRPYITAYNNRGRQIFSRKLKNNIKPTVSPNGLILGLVTYADRSPTDLKTVKLEMFDRGGKFKWKLDKPKASTFQITNKGSFFGIEGVQGISPTRVHVYDQYGDRTTILVFDKYLGLLPSPSASKFIVDQGRDGLAVFDSLGNELAVLPAAGDFIFDKDDRYIGTFSGGVFRLYQDTKEIVSLRHNDPKIVDLAINVEADLVVLMSETSFGVYGLTTRALLWEYTLPEAEQNFTSLDLTHDGQRFACGVDVNLGKAVSKENRHVEGHVFIFGVKNRDLNRHTEKYSLWGVGIPKGVFSTSGGSLIVQTREKLERFRLR